MDSFPNRADDGGREAFEFIEVVERLSTPEQIMDEMRRVLARFGVEFFCFNTFPRPEQKFDEVMLASRLPQEWLRLYIDAQFVHADPSIRYCKQTVLPFEWKEAPYDPAREPGALEVVQRATDFGLSKGLLVPVPSPTGCLGDLWMGGYHFDLSERTKPMIHLIGLYAFDRMRRLRTKEQPAKPALTPREREVLAWVAQGKSAWEIGEILNIAKRTVDEHVQSSSRKLGARTRAQAVAIGLLHRLIEP